MVDQFLMGRLRNFIYLITIGNEAMVIDPQADLSPWEKKLTERGAHLTGVLLTHTHWDHVEGVPAVAAKYPNAKMYVHESDSFRLEKYTDEVRARFVFIKDGDKICLGNQTIEVLHTPGHSAGECCYMISQSPPLLFTGDTVFVNEVGRTDLETGSTAELFATLQRLKKLPPETIIYPGHDYGKTVTSTIARESAESAAFRCQTIEELHALP